MSELLKKQNYGVEVEFTGISRKMAADAVAEIIGTTASRPDHTCYQTRTVQDSQGRKCETAQSIQFAKLELRA